MSGRTTRTGLSGAAYRRVARPVLFGAYGGDAERVHAATLAMLARVGDRALVRRALSGIFVGPSAPVSLAGIAFPNRVGLAAGMDKDGVGLRTWAALGFGHAELGTVTPRPQPGNERPRLVRLPGSAAILNRMGFNNAGAEALAGRLAAAGVRRGNGAVGIPLGISMGKNKDTPLEEAAEDYRLAHRLLAPYADYLAVNVSSPNTDGLRSLQDGAALRPLLHVLTREPAGPPLFLKLSPDLAEDALEQAVAVAVDAGVAGLIATNTTLARDGLTARDLAAGAQPGGLSGAPLTRRARAVVRFLAERTDLPVIGVGGVLTADDGEALLDAGASLIQLYTGFVYEGPPLVAALNRRFAGRGAD